MKNNELNVESIKKILSKLNYEQLENLLLTQFIKNIDLKKSVPNKEENNANI